MAKEKVEYQTLKCKTIAVLAQAEKSILENNEYKAQQTRLDEENRNLLSEIAELRFENDQLKNDLVECKTSSDNLLRSEVERRSQHELELSKAKAKLGRAESILTEIESKFHKNSVCSLNTISDLLISLIILLHYWRTTISIKR